MMTDSACHLGSKPQVALTDVLTSVGALPKCSNSTAGWFSWGYEDFDVHVGNLEDPRVAIVGVEHALECAGLRQVGRTEVNESAEPSARHSANEYPDRSTGIEERIRGFSLCSENWDGDSAKEIPLAAIYASLNFLDHVQHKFAGMEPNSAAPSPDGEVVLYWHGPNSYAEVNFGGDGKLSMCWADASNEIQLIEEDDESTVEPCKGRVWKALSEFLDHAHYGSSQSVPKFF